MNFNVVEALGAVERLNFAQNYSIARPTVLDTLIPDQKTQFWKADYYRLMEGSNLPDVAFVHALDTEAEIGTRPSFEKVLLDKLLIKRKIDQNESLQQAIEHGVPDDASLMKFVYDDASNLFEGVLAKTKVLKGQALSTGRLVINENNVNLTIDYGMKSGQKVTLGKWANPATDIIADIQALVTVVEDNGYVPNVLLTSKKNIGYMRNNTGLQKAIYGANQAHLITKQDLANFVATEWGLTIQVCDEKFRYKKANGDFATGRYFKEDSVTVLATGANGAIGTGLWGPTPEENEFRQFTEYTGRQFISLSCWATPDPVTNWTKASGMFIPVLPTVAGMAIGTVTAGE